MRSLWPLSISLIVSNLLVLVSAHTQIYYPPWRNNSFNAPFSQTIYPCAGIVDNAQTNRTLWPLNGGSLNFTLHDAAAIIFVNLGLGPNATNFNISLLAVPLNETGAGNVCFPQLTVPAGLPIEEGTQATIQLATSNPSNGEGLYNCADITFSANASLLPSNQCVNSSVTINPLFPVTNGSSNGSSNGTSGSGSSKPSSAVKAFGDFNTLFFALVLSFFLTVMI